MKKFFTALMLVAMTVTAASATTFTITSAESQTKDGITVSFDKGSGNNAPAVYNEHLRLYAKNTITVTGSSIQNVSLTFSKQGGKDYASLTASPGTLTSAGASTSNDDLKTDVWSGSASSVTFTLGDTGQRIIYQIVVNGDGSEDIPTNPGNPSEPDTPSTLDPDFVYPEPTVIATPGTTVQGEAYTFVESNILVSCTKGAVNDGYFSAHAGFDMTFTATKPIKGIVINGFVKKDFEATVSNGTATYLTPSEDTAADPVMVIKDINSTSVTISCVKQLRCYTVEIYFNENPDATVSDAGSGNVVDLTFDMAEAVYMSEFVEDYGHIFENYSVFLMNADSYDFPYFSLDIYPDTQDDIVGSYSLDDDTLGLWTFYLYGPDENSLKFAWAEDGQATITKSGDIYTIKANITCDNNVTYNISFTGKVDFYTDKNYGEDSGVEDIFDNAAAPADGVMYDLTGRRVGDDYRGIYIRDGKKYIGR